MQASLSFKKIGRSPCRATFFGLLYWVLCVLEKQMLLIVSPFLFEFPLEIPSFLDIFILYIKNFVILKKIVSFVEKSSTFFAFTELIDLWLKSK